ncbi:MAG: DegT/DnrJ/EryC1/StrS family aminotransferase [Rhodospirillaceae bacterium]|nr:DegT/DnrJ/EryC1/StrS family aminotransferase [Rhodospirillaceae bacterium]
MSKLAILGGPKTVDATPRKYRSMGPAEKQAVAEVMDSDCLSGFYGSWGDEFLGGPRVKAFEAAWAKRFGARHAVSVNSATSGLFAAMGAIGLGPGDEVIVPPTTMSATAMAPLAYGGIPVFADIEDETFCIDPDAVRAAIGPRTKAIIAVNLFGHPARLHELRALADERGLHLIEDNAQAVLAAEKGKYTGTIGHIGVFSLNYHKHIHTGEGGVCLTDDDNLALRLQMIRNHAENVVEPLQLADISSLIGFNYRLGELAAAVGTVQLANADTHIGIRVRLGEKLSAALAGLEGLTAPRVRPGCTHAYYVWSARYDEKVMGVPREVFSRALDAEGFPHFLGYVRPLYHLPLFQRRIGFGKTGFPFTLTNRRYEGDLCPVAERLHRSELLCFETCMYDVSDAEIDQFAAALRKVHAARRDLLALAKG